VSLEGFTGRLTEIRNDLSALSRFERFLERTFGKCLKDNLSKVYTHGSFGGENTANCAEFPEFL